MRLSRVDKLRFGSRANLSPCGKNDNSQRAIMAFNQFITVRPYRQSQDTRPRVIHEWQVSIVPEF